MSEFRKSLSNPLGLPGHEGLYFPIESKPGPAFSVLFGMIGISGVLAVIASLWMAFSPDRPEAVGWVELQYIAGIGGAAAWLSWRQFKKYARFRIDSGGLWIGDGGQSDRTFLPWSEITGLGVQSTAHTPGTSKKRRSRAEQEEIGISAPGIPRLSITMSHTSFIQAKQAILSLAGPMIAQRLLSRLRAGETVVARAIPLLETQAFWKAPPIEAIEWSGDAIRWTGRGKTVEIGWKEVQTVQALDPGCVRIVSGDREIRLDSWIDNAYPLIALLPAWLKELRLGDRLDLSAFRDEERGV